MSLVLNKLDHHKKMRAHSKLRVSYIQFLSKLGRFEKTVIQIVVDSVLLLLAFFGAMLFRLESVNFIENIQTWITFIASILFAILAFQLVGLYRAVIRFSLSSQILVIVGKGVALAVSVMYFANSFFDTGIPHSAPIVFGVFALLGVVGVRLLAQYLFNNYAYDLRMPVIVYGAGGAGRQLVRALRNSSKYSPVAFVDDNPQLQQLSIEGLMIKSSSELCKLVQKSGTKVVLLAMPTLHLTKRREIIKKLSSMELEVRTIPEISDIVSGRSKLSDVKKISVEDLLGRDPISPHPELMSKNIDEYVVMVTGAGGSIGSELCRQILEQKPSTLILFEISEFALYTIDNELSAIVARLNPTVRVVPILGSVNDTQLLEQTIKAFEVQTIFHAAAYKHVNMLEENVVVGIRNNVFGTLAITTLAKELGVKNFTLISSDKAVRPTSMMGATKRIAELICQAYASGSCQTNFSIVRFGNVMGSSGSVIPRFQKQIEEGGPLTVTHRDVVRYFMTVREAAQLVIQASAMSKGGDVFVLDMGEPIKIVDIAIAMVRLNGMRSYVTDQPNPNDPETNDIEICFTGLGKGEKLYEELLIGDKVSPTQHPRIISVSEKSLPKPELMLKLDRLSQACQQNSITEVLNILADMQLDYARSSNIAQL